MLIEDDFLKNPCISFWLKDQILQTRERDVLDAFNDVETLRAILQQRLSIILAENK